MPGPALERPPKRFLAGKAKLLRDSPYRPVGRAQALFGVLLQVVLAQYPVTAAVGSEAAAQRRLAHIEAHGKFSERRQSRAMYQRCMQDATHLWLSDTTSTGAPISR